MRKFRANGSLGWKPPMNSSLTIADLTLFVAVVEGGSFVAGGQAHGLTGSAASKAIGRLEAALNARLFQRSSHAISLTDEGRVFLEHALRVKAALHEAEGSLSRAEGEPRGLLRVSLPDAFGRRMVLPIVAEFLDRYRQVRMDVSVTDRSVDLVEEGFDLVVRLAPTNTPPGMVSRVVTRIRAALCASPEYLERYGQPEHLDALSRHQCIVFRSGDRAQAWAFSDGSSSVTRLPISGRIRLDSGEAIREAAVLGLGIAYLPEFLIADDLDAGRLALVLPGVAQGEGKVVALYPSRRHLQPRVRRFVDLLSERFRQTDA